MSETIHGTMQCGGPGIITAYPAVLEAAREAEHVLSLLVRTSNLMGHLEKERACIAKLRAAIGKAERKEQ